MINPTVVRDIQAKAEYIGRENLLPFYSQFIEALEQEANNHSVRIEHPKRDLYRDVSTERKREIKHLGTELSVNIRQAWLWGITNEEITVDTALGLAQRIEPGVVESYRRDQVRIQGSTDLPPRPEKVAGQMETAFSNARSLPPLERALYLHLEVARIHPFSDGNGRTSRMIQNLALRKAGLPPVIVREGEREHYMDLIQDAISASKYREPTDKVSTSEQRFYTYLATKINVALDEILDRAEQR